MGVMDSADIVLQHYPVVTRKLRMATVAEFGQVMPGLAAKISESTGTVHAFP